MTTAHKANRGGRAKIHARLSGAAFGRSEAQRREWIFKAPSKESAMFELKIITRFAAAHQLKMVAEKCENLHGHNWKIEVCVAGEKLNPAGVLVDFGELKHRVAHIIDKLDHKFLNDVDYFRGGHPPSSENVAQFIAQELQATNTDPSVKVTRVTAWESDDACATYIV